MWGSISMRPVINCHEKKDNNKNTTKTSIYGKVADWTLYGILFLDEKIKTKKNLYLSKNTEMNSHWQLDYFLWLSKLAWNIIDIPTQIVWNLFIRFCLRRKHICIFLTFSISLISAIVNLAAGDFNCSMIRQEESNHWAYGGDSGSGAASTSFLMMAQFEDRARVASSHFTPQSERCRWWRSLSALPLITSPWLQVNSKADHFLRLFPFYQRVCSHSAVLRTILPDQLKN